MGRLNVLYYSPILVVIIVVFRLPILPADITELIPTAAGHMVAALVLLNDKLAFFALTIVQLLLEEHQFLFLAFALVLPQQTLRAKLRLALVADHNPLEGGANEAFAVFLGTEFHVWVFGGDVELVQFSVGPLHVGGELFEEVGVGVEQSVAVFAGTAHFFEGFDFVDGVVVQARLAKAFSVLAVADEQFPFLFLHLTLTYFTVHYLPHVLNLTPEHRSQLRLFNILFCLFTVNISRFLEASLHETGQFRTILPDSLHCILNKIFSMVKIRVDASLLLHAARSLNLRMHYQYRLISNINILLQI